MYCAPFVVHDLVELILRLSCLFALRAVINSPDNIVWLTFTYGVPLATAATMIIVAIPIVVIVSAWEAAPFLFFLVRLELHHVR